jgi:hypothetical protein
MSSTSSSDLGAPTRARSSAPTGWAGLVVFAAVLMMMNGLFTAIAGLAAIVNDDYYKVASAKLLVFQSYTAWGWVHLLFGVLIFLAGIGLLSGNPMARVVGVILAGLNAIVALAFSQSAPVWAAIVVAIDVLVIYALTVHGREMERV